MTGMMGSRATCLALFTVLLVLGGRQVGGTEGRRGDVDASGDLDLTDGINVLAYLFLGSFTPYCEAVADAGGDGEIDVSDGVRILGFLFLGDPPLPALRPEEQEGCKINDPPVILPRPVYRTYPGFPAEFSVAASDPEGDEVRFQPIDFPAGATLDEAGLLRWTPGPDQVGIKNLRLAAIDTARVPNRAEGEIVFQIMPLDACTRPRCDPALGCEADLAPLAEECCGDPPVRVFDPKTDCPEATRLQVGRNLFGSPTTGQLFNCDRLTLIPLGQGGHFIRINLEAPCLEPGLVDIKVRLETAMVLIFEESSLRAFQRRSDGVVEARELRFIVDGRYDEGEEAQLTVWVTYGEGLVLEKKLRVVFTYMPLPDLP